MKKAYEVVLDLQLPEKVETAVQQPVQQTVLSVKDLEKELLVLRLAFGKLKATAYDAIAPLAAVFTRAVSGIVWSATRMIKLFGQVVSALFGITGAGKVTEKRLKKMGKTAQRSLAGFDTLERLDKNSGGAGYTTVETQKPVFTKISEDAQRIADNIKAMFAPLWEFDQVLLRWSLARLDDQVETFFTTVGQLLTVLWTDHLIPFGEWLVEQALPVVNYFFNRCLQILTFLVQEVGGAFLQMLTDIRPFTDFLKDVLLDLIDQVGRFFLRMRQSMETDGSALAELFQTLGGVIRYLWDTYAPLMRQFWGVAINLFRGFSDTVFSVMESVIRVISGALVLIGGLLTKDWGMIWDGMGKICKNAVNAIIGVLNLMIHAFTAALNAVINVINKTKIKVPDWVPGLGGKTYGFSIKTVKAPQIPYLAKGAVLPANQPFLAMVGDQKHGTNIEAPLATIQEAVAVVLGDQVDAMMAGFEALLRENRQLRQTVENIQVGDTVIGQAAARYNRRQAVVQGGVL